MLMNVASFGRGTTPLVMSQLNIRPVFDVDADVQGRDLNSAAADIDKVIAADRPDREAAISVSLSGQVETMRESYAGLFSGMALAVVLVYLFLVINFQSWLDPLIVLMAVPFALGGVMWMLYLTGTHLSVPALMGTLMCIGLTTANSILVVTFANQRMAAGDDAALAAATRRLHPHAPGVDDRRRHDPRHDSDGARARRGRRAERAAGPRGHRRPAVRHFATLVFVPTVYRLLRRSAPARASPNCRRSPCHRLSMRGGSRGAQHAEHTLPATERQLRRAAVGAGARLFVAFLIVHSRESRTPSAASWPRETGARPAPARSMS